MLEGIKGSWYLNINNIELFSDQITFFRVIEQSDLSLPVFELSFRTDNKDLVKKYFTKTYPLNVKIGYDNDPQEEYNLIVTKRKQLHIGNNFHITVSGFLNKKDYLYSQYFYSERKVSTEVIKDVCNLVDLNPKIFSSSDDEMLWISHGLKPIQFAKQLFYYGFFEENNPVLGGIDRFENFWFFPLKDIIDSGIILSNKEDAGNVFLNQIEFENDEGLLSSVSPKELKSPFYHIEDRVLDEDNVVSKDVFTPYCLIDTTKMVEYKYLNDNVHKNWIKAYLTNFKFRTQLFTTRLKFKVFNTFKFNLLTKVKLYFFDQNTNKVDLDNYMSGDYIVTKIITGIESQTQYQWIEISREGYL